MYFPFFIAKRYFIKKQKNNFVNVISWTSLVGITIGTAALILVLSVFNGFENLILKMYNNFDPHLKITSVKGKTFKHDKIEIDSSDIKGLTYVLEEKVLLRYLDKEVIA